MKLVSAEIIQNKKIARDTFSMALLGDWADITKPGQFINIKLQDKYLRRPISVCNLEGEILTIAYKIMGDGTEKMTRLSEGVSLEILSGLGNGFDITKTTDSPLLVGGGAGAAPLYLLARRLIERGLKPRAVLGFNTSEEIFMAAELSELGVLTSVATLDGSLGVKGFVTDAMEIIKDKFDYVFACGPEPMLKAIDKATDCDGQFSFEARMACGFGACMGCSCKTKYGSKRICKDGPVLERGEIIW
ncbi:dihydroorotate dehydrogenase electron transfer subunit [Clostridiaceae bacterium OttesenSCG-928-D20]|nr:dihydroorotate dehydrogenase electron transfer subunit [Clostridiaceae bacterium OttesenSCG-928-D20]